MNFTPKDIIVRNKKHGQDLWVSHHVISSALGISDKYARKVRAVYVKDLTKKPNILPDTGKSWRWAKMNGQFYYDYDRIPDRAPKFYRSHLPARDELLAIHEKQAYASAQQVRDAAKEHLWQQATEGILQSDIEYYCFEAPVKFTPQKASELSHARALCQVFKKVATERSYKALGLSKSADFWEVAAALTSEKHLEGLKMDSPAALRKKVLYNFPDERNKQLTSLINGRYGNDNRKVVGKWKVVNVETGEIMRFDPHEAIIYNAWMNPGKANKLRKNQVYSQYLAKCDEYGLDPVAERTVVHYLNRFPNRAMMSLERDGKDHFNTTYKPYIPQMRPQFVGSLWAIDYSGTKLLYRYYKEQWKGGRKVRRLATGSLYMLRIFDLATDCIVGYALNESGEDWRTVGPALKMAIELNDGCAARELVTDNGPAFSTTDAKARLSMLFDKHRNIQLGNKQANRAEMLIRLMSDRGRQFENWSRLGFYSRHADNVANPDYMDPDQLPWKDDAIRQVEQLVNDWNNTPRPDGSVPLVEFSKNERKNKGLKPVSERAYRFAFGRHTAYALDRCRGVLELSMGTGASREHQKFEFSDWVAQAPLIDEALYGSTDMKVKVVWDESGADIYTPDGRFVLTVPPAGLSHSTEFEQTDASVENFERWAKNKAKFERGASTFAESVGDAFEAIQGEEVLTEDLDYLQRAALNKGRAKYEHNRIMQQKTDPMHQCDGCDDDTSDLDVRDQY